MDLFNYLQDGADYQAKGVLAYLTHHDGIDESYDQKTGGYKANPKIARWENCREQGYIVYMKAENYSKQINIAFFEHRNSDRIHAVKWLQHSTNALTIDTAIFGSIYSTKWDTSHSVGYGKVVEMAEWVYEELANFWAETKQKLYEEKDI